MRYTRSTTPSTSHNVHRRRKRRFDSLASTHPTLITLFKIPEIAMFAPEIESVMADFYDEGIRFAIMECAYTVDAIRRGDFGRPPFELVRPT
jgi:hypothetical protein